MREIETIGNRQAGVTIGGRQAHSDLAVILLAELSTILSCHGDQVLAFLGYAGVVDDQRPDRAVPLHDGKHAGAHRHEHRAARPVGLCYEVMQRLMRRRLHTFRLHARSHRLDAVAIAGQQESRTVRLELRHAIGVTQAREPPAGPNYLSADP
jgi:hypothetical protein